MFVRAAAAAAAAGAAKRGRGRGFTCVCVMMGSSSMNSFFHKPPASDSSAMSAALQIVHSVSPILDTADAADDGSQASAPAPFLTKTYDMVDDPATDAVVSWSTSGKSFVVWNPPEFSRDLLPNYFKHNNFSSFVRQLNTYGFRKVDPEKWEFANDGFLQGKRQFLKNIHRRKPASHSHSQVHQGKGSSPGACVEVGKFGLEREVERLKRDKSVLMMELVRLRQQQQQTERELQLMGQRYHDREQRQQKMISFFARAVKNPSFFSQLVEQNERFSSTRKRGKFSSNDENESESSEPESTTGLQMVRYQPNIDAKGSMIFSNALDSAAKRDTLNLMVDEKRQESDESPQSGVSLVEMRTSSSGAEEVLDCKLSNFSKRSSLNLSAVSSLYGSDAQKEKPTLGAGELLESIELSLATRGGGNPSPKSRPTEKTPISEDGAAVAGNSVTRPPINDVFWEQYLSGTPASFCPGTKLDAGASKDGLR